MPQLAGLTVLRAGSQVSSGCVQRQITPQAAHASASLGQSAAWVALAGHRVHAGLLRFDTGSSSGTDAVAHPHQQRRPRSLAPQPQPLGTNVRLAALLPRARLGAKEEVGTKRSEADVITLHINIPVFLFA